MNNESFEPTLDLNAPPHTQTIEPTLEPPSRASRIMKLLGWFSTFFGLLIFFTLLKLPQDKIQGYLLSTISGVLAEQGMTFTASKTEVSLLLTPSISLMEVVLRLPQAGPEIRLDKIKVSPSILALLTGRMGASFSLVMGESQINGTASVKGKEGKDQDFKLQLNLNSLDLRKTGLLSSFAKINGSGIVDGDIHLNGSLSNANTWTGNVQISLNKVSIDSQNISGFNIPKISISESRADLGIEQGKLKVQTLRLGKTGNAADDIHANLTGDITLANRIENSTLKLRAKFDLSKTILEFPQFALVGALLMPAKQSDGSYVYDLTGPLYGLNPMPVPQGSP